jgi:hypothetical protein
VSPAFEAFLARIYVDSEARERFLQNPYQEALRAGLSQAESEALSVIDRAGLEFASSSFGRKRRRGTDRRSRAESPP